MEAVDLEALNFDYNKLYKLHTGHTVHESDTDSSDSGESSTVLERNKPTLYTYEELKNNSVIIKVKNEKNESGLKVSNSEVGNKASYTDYSLIKEELEKLLFKDSCALCNLNGRSEHDIKIHIKGKLHRKKVDEYIKNRLEALGEEKISESTYGNSHKQITSSRNKTNLPNGVPNIKEKLEEKLKKLILPDYCYVCYANLSEPDNAYSHYNSRRHKNNVAEWKARAPEDFIVEEKLEELVTSDYCYICCANLGNVANANSHYNSRRHHITVEEWKLTQINMLKSAKKENIDCKNEETLIFQNQSSSMGAAKSSITTTPNKYDILKNDASTVKSNVNINTFCMVCSINVGTALQAHYKSDAHRRSVELFCFVCNIKTMSKDQLAEHVKGIWHKKNLNKMTDNNDSLRIPQTIVAPVVNRGDSSADNISVTKVSSNTSVDPLVPTSCSICNIKFGNAQLAKEHYKSINHQRKIEKSQPVAQVSQKSVPSRWCYCEICKMALDGTVKAEDHYKEKNHILTNTSFYCYICKMTFDKMRSNFHVKSFPHNEVAKLKSLVVSKGISTQEFWIFDEAQILCNLCEVSIQSESTAASHLGCKRHINNFNSWCSQQLKDTKDSNRRWYFCDICNKGLDGTTFIELHYQGKSHAMQQKKLNDQQITGSSESNHIVKKDVEDIGKTCISEKENHTSKNENGKLSKPVCEPDKTSEKVADNNDNTFYCYACKMKFTSQIEMSLHIKTFPHNYIAELKSMTVGNGVATKQFWMRYRFSVLCTLCNAMLPDETSVISHFQNKIHTDKLNIWYRQQQRDTKDPNRKWHFCDICKISLDGTTNAELHYQDEVHTKKLTNTTSNKQVTIKRTFADIAKTEIKNEETVEDGPLKETDKNDNATLRNQELNTKMDDVQKILEQTKKTIEELKLQSIDIQDSKVNNEIIFHSGQDVFICYVCKKKFTSQSELNDHVEKYCTANVESSLVSKDITNVSNSSETPIEKIKDKEEQTEYLREMIKLQMEKFINTVNFIPPNKALQFLQKYTQELENLKKEYEAPNVNMNFINKTKEAAGKSISKNHIIEKNQYILSEDIKTVLSTEKNNLENQSSEKKMSDEQNILDNHNFAKKQYVLPAEKNKLDCAITKKNKYVSVEETKSQDSQNDEKEKNNLDNHIIDRELDYAMNEKGRGVSPEEINRSYGFLSIVCLSSLYVLYRVCKIVRK